jgi:uncharacterized phiE125 gp8 family phage protein
MALKLVTPPALELITLEEAKVHLRLGLDEHPEDVLISSLCRAAREACERIAEEAFVTSTWDYFRDDIPAEVAIPLGQVQYFESIGTKDSGGTLTTDEIGDTSPPATETDDWLIDVASGNARLIRKSGIETIKIAGQAQVFQVRFVAGYGDPWDVPEKIKAAVLLMLAHLYEHRGDEGAAIPETIQFLLRQDYVYPMP